MAKPYDFESPIVTENGLKRVAEIIKTNYPDNDALQEAISNVDLSSVNNQIQQLQTQVTQVTTKVGEVDISGLESRVSSIESDLDGLLTVLEEVVG